MNYFELFEIPVSFQVDKASLSKKYFELQKKYHPDFQQNRGPKLKQLAEHESQLLNWARDELLKRC